MNFDAATEKRIRGTVKPGDPWALDDLTEEICRDDEEKRREFSEIVADEYRRRLSAIQPAAVTKHHDEKGKLASRVAHR